jgi:hypothetical protein
MTLEEQVDRAHRVAYQAYPVMRRWWCLLKRRQFVVVAVWLDDTVLAVRHSYKPGMTLLYGGPGGARIIGRRRHGSYRKR